MTFRIRYAFPVFILISITPLLFAQGGVSLDKPSEGKSVTLQKIPTTLEEMLAIALQSNPDIRVAEADLLHAMAKVKQIRLKMSQAAVEAYHQRKMRQNTLAYIKMEYAKSQQRREAGRESEARVDSFRTALLEAETALAESEVVILTLIGLGPSEAKMPKSLEDMLSRALQSNGEIALAEADFLRMQARSDQIRLKVTEEVTTTYQMRRVKENAVKLAKRQLQKAIQRREKGIADSEGEHIAIQAMIEAEAELVHVEAHIRYLLGLGGIIQSRDKKKSESLK